MAISSSNDGGPRSVLLNVAENTTLHGVPNAYRSHSWIRKTIWSVLCLASFGMCLYQVSSNFRKYYSYPTSSTFSVVSGSQLEFPAVTICNMNPVRGSMMNETVQEDLSEDQDRWTNSVIFQQWYASLNETEKTRMGHSLDHMLLSCEFAGVNCSDPRFFTPISNGQYGNCYIFNEAKSKRFSATSVGPTGGLILELYIEQSEYLPILSDTAGIRLVVHNQTYMPLPEKEGVTLAPGFESSIAITRSEGRRAKPPYGKCADVTVEENKDLNVYTHLYEHVHYTYQACRFTCYQQNVLEECDCGDASYPLSGRPFPLLNGGEARPCATTKQQECVDLQKQRFNHGDDNCTDACPIMCLEIFYAKQLSFGLWPSQLAEEQVFKNIEKRMGPAALNVTMYDVRSEAAKMAWVRQNVVKVLVYFEWLDVNTQTTAGSYSVVSLLSDQGGQVGLWLGLSVLTLFEMVELLWDLFASVLRPVNRKTAAASNGSKDPENPTM